MANIMRSYMTLPTAVAVLLVLLVVRRLMWELTTGARRRRMIREHGCQPAYWYPHKGIQGKLLGLDVLNEALSQHKEGRFAEGARLRNFVNTGVRTLWQRMLRNEVILTIEPENVKTMLSTKFNDYSLGRRRREVFIPFFGHGIFDTDGKEWERSRALIRPNFVRAQVADLKMFEEHIQHLVDAIPRDGSTVDLQDLFFGLTMDSATQFLFGKSTNSLKPGLDTRSGTEFVNAYQYGLDAVARNFLTSGLSAWIPDAKWRKSVKIVHKFADEMVQAALDRQRASKGEKYDEHGSYVFLDSLVQRTQDPYTLRSEVLNVLLAGRDTTAGLLSNTWHVLSNRPDIWAKLQAEVDTLDGALPDYSSLKDMKYLKWVLNECLRLYPVVPSNSRDAIRDTVIPLGGGPNGTSPVFVPQGTTVNYGVWSIHRRTDLFGADALEFKPERWETLRPGWEYLPFNGGPRICVGQQYALTEASYATVRLMQQFRKIESRDNMPWKEYLTVTLASGNGCKVALYEK